VDQAAVCEGNLAGLLDRESIEFASGSASIVPAATSLLDRIADLVRDCPGVVRVEGHTDSSGDPEANRALSAARAEAVRSALGARGVPPDRLVAAGFGSANPIADNATAEGRARNRRIAFRVLNGTN
jgi:outer membrane protein OmpA-like peptidoglycan-associated protein